MDLNIEEIGPLGIDRFEPIQMNNSSRRIYSPLTERERK